MPDPAAPAPTQPVTKPAVDATASAPKPLRVPIADKVAGALKAHADKVAAAKPAAEPDKPADKTPDPKPDDKKPDEAAKAKADAKPPEPKPEDKKLSQRFAELAEREAKHTESSRTLKDQAAKLENDRKAFDGELTLAKEMRQLRELAKADPVAAFKALGADVDAFLERYVENLKPADPREVARKEFERLRAEEQRQADEQKKTAEAESQKQFDAAKARWVGEIETLSREMGDKFGDEFDLCVAYEVTGEQVFARAWAEGLKTNKLPSPREALELVEKDLQERITRSKKFGKKESKADKQEVKAGDKAPQTLTPDGGAEVPLAEKPNGKRTPVKDRVREVLRQRGLS